MNTEPLTVDMLRRSVIAVPPLARNQDYSLNRAENKRLVRHIESGGVTILLYGGNANLYHVALSEYAALLELLSQIAAPETTVIPSVGPAYGTMMDQAAVLRDFAFPTAMVLPQREISTPSGVARAVRDFVDASRRPAVLYVKHENYICVDAVRRLMDEGTLCAVKYAIVRNDPSDDRLLHDLIDAVGPERIVSGMGEQPAVVHVRDFGLPGFTSGCVCVRPDLSMSMLRAVQSDDFATADRIRAAFRPLEDLRNTIHPIRVLHRAVALAKIAETGPMLPCLTNIDAADEELVHDALVRLSRFIL